MFFSKTYAAICGFATLSSAHMIMSSPKPFGTPGQAPLLEDGSNFPCQVPDYDSTSASVMPKGSQQELAFIGQAVHGGGSCQISITYDTHPTKDSVWKVIHSIQGGCPAKNEAGNMGNSASAADPYTYSFTIPEDIPTGKATLAWTWLNRIGNREFYMNCAPVSITGGDGDKANFEALPDMLVANIAAITECSTTGLDNFDYAFPNPGSSVDNFNMTVLKPLPDVCGKKVSGGGSGSGSSTSAPVASVAPTSTSTANAGVPPTTLAGGVFITVKPSSAASSVAAAQPTTEAAPTTTAVQVPPTVATEAPATTASVAATTLATSAAPAATTTASSGSSGSSGSSSGSTSGAMTAGSACSTEGQWNCVDGTSFQRCASGTWSAVMALASGMSCTPGQSATLNMKATNGKMRRRLTRFRA